MDVVVPISALEHDAYCPRQAAIIHVDGFWRDNSHTVRGTRGHQRVDTEGHRSERGRRVIRGLPLWSERWGLSGRADVVEITADDMIEARADSRDPAVCSGILPRGDDRIAGAIRVGLVRGVETARVRAVRPPTSTADG
jgi:hypothetical protein